MTDIKDNTIPTGDELIVIKQLPIIEEQLHAIKARFEEEVNYVLSLDCTDESVQEVKKARANLTKMYNFLEDRRKKAKADILSPYDAFEKVYKECVTDVYEPCKEQLDEKIDGIERELKDKKQSEAIEYFNEYCVSKNIDFIKFEQAGINITLTVSKKKVHEQINAFVDKIVDDLELIKLQENIEEVFVEYKKTLNVSKAITEITNRHREIIAEKEKAGDLAEKELQKNEVVKKVEETVIEEMLPPVSIPETNESEKVYEAQFIVRGSIQKLRLLKEFLTNGGYDYEQQ